jgi:hypothetical protein
LGFLVAEAGAGHRQLEHCPVSPNLARQHAADLRRTRFAETSCSWLSH